MGSVSADRVVRGGGWGHTQGDMHIVAARLGFEKAWTDLERYFQLVEGWFLARKATLAVSGLMTTDSADYCMLVNKWVWSKSRVCLLRLEVDMGSTTRDIYLL